MEVPNGHGEEVDGSQDGGGTAATADTRALAGIRAVARSDASPLSAQRTTAA